MDEKGPIYAPVTINGERMDLSMKQKIKIEDWSDQKGMAKTKKEEFRILNNYLEQMRSSFVECYRDMTIIEEQPKNITKNFRILLFPEHNAREYYKVVFGRLLFWMMIFLIATYLFSLGKQFIDSNTAVRYKEAESYQYRKAWIYLYLNSKKSVRAKMDSGWIKS
jgi:hypothetical protein